MTGRCRIAVWTALGCLLVTPGCMTRKGFIIGADLKLEFNRIPWRTGPHGQYEVDGPDCLDCPPHGAKPGAACPPGGPGMPPGGPGAVGGCPAAPLPGDCGLPASDPHPRSRFHPLPMHDVLNGALPLPPPQGAGAGQAGEIIREEALPEVVPQAPAKPLNKLPPAPPADPTKTQAPFQLEEKGKDEEGAPSAKIKPRSTLISSRSRPATSAATGRRPAAPTGRARE